MLSEKSSLEVAPTTLGYNSFAIEAASTRTSADRNKPNPKLNRSRDLSAMILIHKRALDGSIEPSCRISRSEITSFKGYHINTDTYAKRTDYTTWTTRELSPVFHHLPEPNSLTGRVW